jgi:cell division protease FtsH
MSSREREIVAYHEAGHAIVACMLPGVDPVHKISIVQRGYEALGHTLQLPAEEQLSGDAAGTVESARRAGRRPIGG